MSEVDIDAIMAEIHAEVEKNRSEGLYEDLPDFNDLPIMEPRVKEWTVECAYPPTGSPLKRVYTKLVSKLTRAALFPVTERITKTNLEIKTCLEEMASMIEEQREEIEELTRRVEELEKQTGEEPAGNSEREA